MDSLKLLNDLLTNLLITGHFAWMS